MVTVTTEFNNIVFVNYVYRQDLPVGNTAVSTDLSMSINGGVFGKSASLRPGDKIAFKYSATNSEVPGVWSKVTAVQSLGGLFKPVSPMPAGVTEKDGLLYVPLNLGAINDLRPGETGTNTVTMTYQGATKANLTTNDQGQITVTNNPITAGIPQTSTVVSKVAIYDQSNQLIDDTGAPIYGSYFYSSSNDKSPLASSDPVYSTGNYIPSTDSVTLNDLGWWTYDAGVLTIYPHELDADVDQVNVGYYTVWPWDQYKSQIKTIVIKPGVSGRNSLRELFYNFPNLENFDGLTNLDTTRATDMRSMFSTHSTVLTSLDLSNLDTSNVLNMDSMFMHCRALINIDLTNFNTSKVTNMNGMFTGCVSATEIKFDKNKFITSNVLNMWGMFYDCMALTSLDVTGFDTSNVTDMSYMFYNCRKLTELDVANFDTSKVTSMLCMFNFCVKLNTLDLTNFNTSNVTNMRAMFSDCNDLTNLDVTHFDTSKVTDMGYMFDFCNSLTSLDVSNFITSEVTRMDNMFAYCSTLTSLDLRNFNTSKVEYMNHMFMVSKNLKTIDVSSFDTGKVINIGYMFYGCNKVTSLDVTNFNTSNVTDMGEMFGGCGELTSIDVSHFDTSKVRQISGLFSSCIKLTSLDLSNFDMSQLLTIGPNPYYSSSSGMFSNTPSLWKLKLGPKVDLSDKRSSDGTWVSVNLGEPTAGTAINDLDQPTPVYYAINAKWREVGTGTPHDPKGAFKSAEEICSETLIRTDVRTYVWDQEGKQTMTMVSNIDLGTHLGTLRNHEYSSDDQTIDLTDNRNVRSGKTWQITAAVTQPFTLATDTTQKISGDPIFHQDITSGNTINLKSTAQTIYSGTAGTGYQDLNSYNWKLKFKSASASIPKMGTYNAIITYTLINDTP